MRIAVVGSGISGLSASLLLSRQHDVVLYEAGDRLGGHTDTHRVEVHGRMLDVDTGFIVHNPVHYPLLTRLFEELGVASQDTTMGFSVQDARSGLEYNATSLDALFCQRRNLASPRFWGMLRDLVRFYRNAPALLDGDGPGPSLGEYLHANGYGEAFREQHLVPMASALWSTPASGILQFPARHLVQFMANHHMLQLTGRPPWRVVRGGSSRYIEAMTARWDAQVRLASPVRGVLRDEHGVRVRCDDGETRFDQVVLACHSDQALAMLDDASDAERDILGALTYQANDTVLHTDARLLPRNRKAWAAWNAFLPADPDEACTVSYCMNLLQGLPGDTPLIVSLNRTQDIDPARILRRRQYHHPVHTHAAVAAQARRHEIQGVHRTWFAGAYWGWGFHEDGIRSGVEVARALGVTWPGASASQSASGRATPGIAVAMP